MMRNWPWRALSWADMSCAAAGKATVALSTIVVSKVFMKISFSEENATTGVRHSGLRTL